MSDVEFDTDQDNPRYRSQASSGVSFDHAGESGIYGQPQKRGMAGWLVRHGVVSGDSGAKSILIGIVCINFIISAFIIYYFVLR
jgi:hypothetical protein